MTRSAALVLLALLGAIAAACGGGAGASGVHDAAPDVTSSDVASTADAGRDAGAASDASDAGDVSDAADASDTAPLDALADTFFPFPDVPPSPEGLAGCTVNSPANGGGCVCSERKGGHFYQVNCEGSGGMCTCSIDGTPTKTVSSDACGMDFTSVCGFS